MVLEASPIRRAARERAEQRMLEMDSTQNYCWPHLIALALTSVIIASAAGQDVDLHTIHVRAVTEAGDPVPAAWIGTYAHYSESMGSYWRLNKLEDVEHYTNAEGRAVVRLPIWPNRTRLLWAWRLDGSLVGSAEAGPDTEELEIAMKPACRVFGQLVSPELKALDRELKWTHVYACDDEHRPLLYSSSSGRFEFHLPPGKYTLSASGEDLSHLLLDVTVPPETDELDVGTIELPASKLAKLYGKPAPEFREIKGWMNGEPTTLKALRGQFVLLDFWGYWCGPCIAQMPKLMEIHDALGDRGLTIIGIHDDSLDYIDELDRYLARARRDRWNERRIPFLLALDGGGEQSIEGTWIPARGATTAAYGIMMYPTTVLIGSDGTVLENFRFQSADEAIERLAAKMGVEPKPLDERN